MARHLRAADDRVERHEHVVAARRAVLERNVDREVAPADLDAGQVRRDQRGRDAVVVDVADQVLGVIELEREAEHGRDRRERDVALVPVEPDADDLAALVRALRRRRRCRRARSRRSRRAATSARSTASRRRSRGAAASAASARRCRSAAAARRGRASSARRSSTTAVALRDDIFVSTIEHASGEKPSPPYSFGMIIAKNFCSLRNCQTFGGMSSELVRDLPVVEHPAELFGRAVEERLLLGRELRRRQAQQLAPVRHAGEQLAVPPDVAGLERVLLGLRHARQHAAVDADQPARDAARGADCSTFSNANTANSDPAAPRSRATPPSPRTAVDEQQRAEHERRRRAGPCGDTRARSARPGEHEPDERFHRYSLHGPRRGRAAAVAAQSRSATPARSSRSSAVGRRELAAREVVDREPLHDLVLAADAADRVRVDDAFARCRSCRRTRRPC